MKSLMLLFVMLALVDPAEEAAAPAEDQLWVTVYYFNQQEKASYHYMGLIDKALYERIKSGEDLKFVRLSRACWMTHDENDTLTGIEEYEDEQDTGEILINMNLVEMIIVMKGDPHEIHRDKLQDKEPAIRVRNSRRNPTPAPA